MAFFTRVSQNAKCVMDTIKWDIIIVLRAWVQECVYKGHVNIEYDIYLQCTYNNNNVGGYINRTRLSYDVIIISTYNYYKVAPWLPIVIFWKLLLYMLLRQVYLSRLLRWHFLSRSNSDNSSCVGIICHNYEHAWLNTLYAYTGRMGKRYGWVSTKVSRM